MIYVYSQPGCYPCKMAIKMIQDAGIEPEVKNIREDGPAFLYVTEELGATGTPVIVSDKDPLNPILGFTPDTKPRVQELISAELG